MTNRKRLEQIVAESRARMKAAKVVETFDTYRDVFDRSHARVSVELCHGVWCTFARMHYFTAESSYKQHADRETARTYAREWLGRLA